MSQTHFRVAAGAWVALLWATAPAAVQPAEPPAPAAGERWHTTVAPYLWATSLDGNATVHGLKADVDVSFGDLLKDLSLGGMLLVDVGKGPFGIGVNGVFARVHAPQIVRVLCAVGGRCCRRLAAAVAVAVTVAVSRWSWSPSPMSTRRRDRSLSCPGPSPEPDCCRTVRQTGSVKGRRSRSVTPQAPLTGSGCRKHSYGGFGEGHPHFHPHATPARNPRIKRQAHPCRESSKIVRSFGRAWVFAVAAVRRDPVPSDGVAACVAASVPVVASQVAINRQ